MNEKKKATVGNRRDFLQYRSRRGIALSVSIKNAQRHIHESNRINLKYDTLYKPLKFRKLG